MTDESKTPEASPPPPPVPEALPKPKITLETQIPVIQQALVDIWLKNLMVETALPLMGHVLLGQAIELMPELNKAEDCVNWNTHEGVQDLAWRVRTVYHTPLSNLCLSTSIGCIITNIQHELRMDKVNRCKTVVRSLRLAVQFTPPRPGDTYAAATVTFTLCWIRKLSNGE
jgi:hypothetical protein